MYTEGFGEVLTDILTVNPELSSVSSASAILDTSNYTFQAVTFGKDADGFNHHAHTVYTSATVPEDVPYKHLVIFAGQSNMNGVGNDNGGSDLYNRAAYARPASGVKYWDLDTSSFVDHVTPGVNTTCENKNVALPNNPNAQGVSSTYNKNSPNFGPELQFARNILQDNIADTYLFKFAMNGSFLVDLENSEIHKMFGRDVPFLYKNIQDDTSLALTYLNNWNPSGGRFLGDGVVNNVYRNWNRFAAHCSAIIDDLGANTIKSVTFIWAQGEQEALTAQNNSNSYVSGYSATCSYLIDQVSSIFSGADDFYAIRAKVNTFFGSGYFGDYQFYPSGFYNESPVLGTAEYESWKNTATIIDGIYHLIAADDVKSNSFKQYAAYPRVFAASKLAGIPGARGASPAGNDFFGMTGSDKGRPYVPELQAQQEAMDTSIYGPLLDFDDLSATLLDSGTKTSVSAFSGTVIEPNQILSLVSAYVAVSAATAEINSPRTDQRLIENKNFHYNDEGLTEMGRRYYDTWVELVNPPRVNTGASSYNDRGVVAYNFSNDTAPFASSYNISSTYLHFSSTYNSVPNYPNPKDERLERGSTLTVNVSDYEGYSSLRNFGHYSNGGLGRAGDIWNVVGGFPPSGYQNWDYFILSSTASLGGGTDVRDLTYSTGLAASGQLSGVFNADEVMDTSGFLKLSPLTGIGEQLSALGNSVSGSAFSGGALVFSSTDNQAVNGIANVAVRLKDGDAASIALFGGLNHIGVWCLDLKSMIADGLRPPFYWDNLDNIRRYKLVSKVSFWDNLLIHKDNSGQSGMEVLAADPNGDFKFGGPTFLLKFKFT